MSRNYNRRGSGRGGSWGRNYNSRGPSDSNLTDAERSIMRMQEQTSRLLYDPLEKGGRQMQLFRLTRLQNSFGSSRGSWRTPEQVRREMDERTRRMYSTNANVSRFGVSEEEWAEATERSNAAHQSNSIEATSVPSILSRPSIPSALRGRGGAGAENKEKESSKKRKRVTFTGLESDEEMRRKALQDMERQREERTRLEREGGEEEETPPPPPIKEKSARARMIDFLGDAKHTLSCGQIDFLFKVADGVHVFLTGPGGVGKSHVLTLAQEWCESEGLLTYATAFTGTAARLLKGGTTLNGWMGIGRKMPTAEQLAYQIRKNPFSPRSKRWLETKRLIIDEVGMLNRRQFQLLIDTLELLRVHPVAVGKKKNPNRIHTGTLRLIVCGDFLQLPPVEKENEDDDENSASVPALPVVSLVDQMWRREPSPEVKKQLEKILDESLEPFCFLSRAWRKAFKSRNIVVLSKVFRQVQSDQGEGEGEGEVSAAPKLSRQDQFIKALHEVRIGTLSQASLELLKSRYITDEEAAEKKDMLHLYTHRVQINAINQQRLLELSEEGKYVYEAYAEYDGDDGKKKKGKGKRKKQKTNRENEFRFEKTPEQIEEIKSKALKRSSMPSTIELRVGARVMLRVNLDVARGLVNGSTGTVRELSSSGVRVCFDESEQFKSIARDASSSSSSRLVDEGQSDLSNKLIEPYGFSDKVNKTTVYQIPLVLAWACTVHKSQGASLSEGVVDISRAFTEGQVYVALSRFKSIDGLFLTGLLPDEHDARDPPKLEELVQVSNTVLSYYATLPLPLLD